MSIVRAARRAVPGVLAAVVVAALAHAAVWLVNEQQVHAPDVSGKLESLSFAPYNAAENPEKGDIISPLRLREDMEVVAPYTKSIRTYAATGGLEKIPEIANQYGIKVMQGIWISNDEKRNEIEIKNGLDLAPPLSERDLARSRQRKRAARRKDRQGARRDPAQGARGKPGSGHHR